jgi:hypothetical protein
MMLYRVGRCLFSLTSTILVFGSLAAGLLLGFVPGFITVRLDEWWRISLLASQLLKLCSQLGNDLPSFD